MSLDDHHNFLFLADDEMEPRVPHGLPPSTLPGPAEVASEHALAFMLAGRATFTLQSLRSGTHHSFRLLAQEPNSWSVQLLTGPNNVLDWTVVGQLRKAERFHLTTARWSLDASSCKAFWWTICRLSEGKSTPDLEVHHMGTCGACGRPLTTPESVRRGLGPICAERTG